MKLGEPFNIAYQIKTGDAQLFDNSSLVRSLQTKQVFFSAGLEFDTVFHGGGTIARIVLWHRRHVRAALEKNRH
jgi:hypothetical protein